MKHGVEMLFMHNTQIVARLLCIQQTWRLRSYIYLRDMFSYAFIVSKLY